MGKGDQRSRRGKIWRGTFGKRRPKRSKHATAVVASAPAAPAEPPAETQVEAPPRKRPVRKKTAEPAV
jgi:30S ribosomal protein S31